MLAIQQLHVAYEGTALLHDVSLQVHTGSIHVLMGPNGAGKSTLAAVLAGKPGYTITQGSIHFQGKDIAELSVEERAREGIFLAFQQPIEIPGLRMATFLQTALNAQRAHQGKAALTAGAFLQLAEATCTQLGIDPIFLRRELHAGFSGGEKKRSELLQMALLSPKLAILDELDSGLDIDALKATAQTLQAMHDGTRSFIIITHYERLLEYITPDAIHILQKGHLVRTGDASLSKTILHNGYEA